MIDKQCLIIKWLPHTINTYVSIFIQTIHLYSPNEIVYLYASILAAFSSQSYLACHQLRIHFEYCILDSQNAFGS